MKRYIVFFVTLAVQMNFAQNIFPLPSGNVGIGTTSPTSKLEVKGTIKSYETIPLGGAINSSQLINERGGNVGENSLFNRLWVYRDLTLNNWYSARLHDGISIDFSHTNPQVDTRTWWERDPYDNIQSWGDGASTYFTINKGNIGIGDKNPEGKLVLKDNTQTLSFLTNQKLLGTWPPVSDLSTMTIQSSGVSSGNIAFATGNNEVMRIQSGGNIGIGTTSPTAKLHVLGTIKSYGSSPLEASLNSSTLIEEVGSNAGGNNFYKRLWLFRDSDIKVGWSSARLHDGISIDGTYEIPQNNTRTWWERDPNDNIQSWGNANETYFTINKGNIGIGIINPLNKLDVNGTVHSKEVKVDMSGWSDFVFKKEYDLPTLEEVEKHITEKGHLENIPSEEEVLKNGVNLGEMNAKLLQKIEELTLYMIEMKKDIAILKEENKTLKSKNK